MSYFRPFLEELEAYVPGEQPRDYAGLTKLNANENAYPPSLQVEYSLQHAHVDDLRYYPDATARELRKTLATKFGVAIDNIIVGNGGDEILRLIVQATVEKGDRVTYPMPGYVLYRTLAQIARGECVEVELDPDFQIPPGFEDSLGRITFLCSPNNPTGNCLRERDIVRVVEAAEGKSIVVIDEAYVDFSDQNLIPLTKRFDNVLVLRSFSKSYSLAGIRLGVGIGHFEIISNLYKLKDSYNVNELTQRLAVAALLDGDYMRNTVRRIRRNRDMLSTALRDLGFRVYPSDANFVLAEHPTLSAREIQQTLRERNILVRHFAEKRVENHLRISVGREDEILTLIENLKEIVSG
jgi:histidinol-phosphate aminotransferase